MKWFGRKSDPVYLAPRHRWVWRGLHRCCSCGLSWRTCPDRRASVPTEPVVDPRYRDQLTWTPPTVTNPQVGRPGRLSPAQNWRANGGRW